MTTNAFSKLTKAFSWCQHILTHFLTILFWLFAAFCHFFAIFSNEVIKRLTGRYYTTDTNLQINVSNYKSKSQKKSRLQLLQRKIAEVVGFFLTHSSHKKPYLTASLIKPLSVYTCWDVLDCYCEIYFFIYIDYFINSHDCPFTKNV